MAARMKLTEAQIQETIELAHLYGPTEAAKRLGVLPNVVHMRLRRFRQQGRLGQQPADCGPTPLHTLTHVERQVLVYMLEGKANKVIASLIGYSLRTVETHRQEIFRKTGADSMAELVQYVYWLIYGRAYCSAGLWSFLAGDGTPLVELKEKMG